MIVPQGKGMNNLESISYLKDLERCYDETSRP
jgi:hypothetical protein